MFRVRKMTAVPEIIIPVRMYPEKGFASERESLSFKTGAFCGIFRFCAKNAVISPEKIEKISIGARRASVPFPR